MTRYGGKKTYDSRPQDIVAAVHFGFISCTANFTQHTGLTVHMLQVPLRTGDITSITPLSCAERAGSKLFSKCRCYDAFGSLLYLMPDPFGAHVSLFRPPAIFLAG